MSKGLQRIGNVEVDEDTFYDVTEEARKSAPSGRGQRLAAAIIMICFGAAALIGSNQPTGRGIVIFAAVTGAGLIITIVWRLVAAGDQQDPGVREALNRRGLNLCVNCGYQLQGLDDNVKQCPECGAARELSAEKVS